MNHECSHNIYKQDMSVKLWFIWVNGIWVSTFWMAMLFFHCLSLQLRKNFSVVVLLEIFSYTLPIRAKTWTYLQSNTIMYAHKHTSSRAMPPLPVVFPGTGLHWHRWWWREEAYKGSLEREWHGQFMSDRSQCVCPHTAAAPDVLLSVQNGRIKE